MHGILNFYTNYMYLYLLFQVIWVHVAIMLSLNISLWYKGRANLMLMLSLYNSNNNNNNNNNNNSNNNNNMWPASGEQMQIVFTTWRDSGPYCIWMWGISQNRVHLQAQYGPLSLHVANTFCICSHILLSGSFWCLLPGLELLQVVPLFLL